MLHLNHSTFISPKYANVLAHNQLNVFAQIWAKKIDWFEEPNQRRGGWSGVGRLTLKNSAGESQVFFLKKQQNHGRRTWRNPITGEPTFRREFANLQLLSANHFAAPVVAFYAEAIENGQVCAVLMTADLTGFIDLERLMQNWLPIVNKEQKKVLMNKVANEINRFHGLGVVHRALYPKHIFVKNAETLPEVAVIDCEKMRQNSNLQANTVFDLSALNRHSQGIRNTERLAFLKVYLQTHKLNDAGKKLARQIAKRSARA